MRFVAIEFQLTRLMRGVTRGGGAELEERREFQLTRLMRGVTAIPLSMMCGSAFQLTRLMRGVTHFLSVVT